MAAVETLCDESRDLGTTLWPLYQGPVKGNKFIILPCKGIV